MKQKNNTKMKKMASVPIFFDSKIAKDYKKSFHNKIEKLNSYIENDIPGQKTFVIDFYIELKDEVAPRLLLKDIEIREENGMRSYKFLLTMSEFFKNYATKQVVFGKELVWDPRDTFEPNSQKLIDIFREMQDCGLEHLFTKRDVEIPAFLLEKIAPLLKTMCINLFPKEVTPEIFINKVKKGYIIDVSQLKHWHILSRTVMLYENNNFFKLLVFEDEFLSGVMLLKNFISDNSDVKSNCEDLELEGRVDSKKIKDNKNVIEIFQDEIDVKKLIDKYKRVIKINYPEELEEGFYCPEKIEPALIFDMEKGILIATTEVLYDGKRASDIEGKISTTPFLIKKALGKAEEIITKNKFVRYHEEGKFCLIGDEKVFIFLTEKLKSLVSQCAIFYTGRLKKKKFISTNIFMKFKEDTELHVSFTIDDLPDDEKAEVLEQLKDGKIKEYFKLKNGGIIRLENKDLDNIKRNLVGLGATKEELTTGVVKRKHYYNFFLNNYNSYDVEWSNYEKYFSRLNFSPRDYQKIGINWLLNLKEKKMGGILADDMGLGKTIQALSFLYINNLIGNEKPSLIIVPKSILYNWVNEIKKYFKNMNYTIATGDVKDRKEAIRDISSNEVIITSYSLINRDINLYKNLEFGTIILDEAQTIKNHNSLTFKSIKLLKRDTCFALTGTPIENHLSELWSIFETVLPRYLGSITAFREKYLRSSEHVILKALIKPFILRRMKKDVLKELPEKIEKDIFIELEPCQKRIYSAFMMSTKLELKNNERIESFMMLKFLTQLRQICTYPRNVVENYNEISGKERVLFDLLHNLIENGHKVIVFSQYTSGLKVFNEKLSQKYKVLYLTGELSDKKRVELVEKFNNQEADIFLISLKAGGVGLNITGADVVIHYDPWWNPAVEAQATDRAYRIGQKKNVLVYNLITKETIEEHIYNMKKAKKHLSENILNSDSSIPFSKEDLIKFFE